MADYLDVTVYPVHALPIDGLELVRNATAFGTSSHSLSLVPDALDVGWKAQPRLGNDYLIEGTAPTGSRVKFIASCTYAQNRHDPAEFLIKQRV